MLYLPVNYTRNEHPSYFDDMSLKDEWQNDVYRLAHDLAERQGLVSVLDYGCGSGFKLRKYFGEGDGVCGLDMPPTVAKLHQRYPNGVWVTEPPTDNIWDLLICSDMIEHTPTPQVDLEIMQELNPKWLVLSTPARQRNDFGPPGNPHHAQEWTPEEFEQLISDYFDIISRTLIVPNKDYHGLTTVITARSRN